MQLGHWVRPIFYEKKKKNVLIIETIWCDSLCHEKNLLWKSEPCGAHHLFENLGWKSRSCGAHHSCTIRILAKNRDHVVRIIHSQKNLCRESRSYGVHHSFTKKSLPKIEVKYILLVGFEPAMGGGVGRAEGGLRRWGNLISAQLVRWLVKRHEGSKIENKGAT